IPEARVLHQIDPRRRAAVHDRHFRLVELDQHVVDAKAAERRQQMLDRVNRRSLVDQASLQLLSAAQMRDMRWNVDAAEIGALKPDAVIGGGGAWGKGDLNGGGEER